MIADIAQACPRSQSSGHILGGPMRMRAARKPLPTRVGHPDFIGPVQPDVRARHGAIQFEDDGTAFFVVRKAEWERARDARILKMAGMDA
jgi:hypothetical protein